jgi:hypothetical protein
VREVAGHDYDKARAIGFWPALELLEAFESHLRRRALAEFQHATLVWTTGYPSVVMFAKVKRPKPPDVPPILRKNDG